MSSQRHVATPRMSQPPKEYLVVPHSHFLLGLCAVFLATTLIPWGQASRLFSMDVQTLGSFVDLESIRGPAHEGHKTNKQTTRAHGVPGQPCWGPRLPTGELDSPPTEETGKGSTVLLTRRALSEEQTPRDRKSVFYSTSAGDCYSAPQFLDE